MYQRSQWPTVRADLHRSFDRSDWILIPSTDVLARIEQRVRLFVQTREGDAEALSDMYDEVGPITSSSAFKLLIQTQFAYTPPDWQEYRVVYLNLWEDITVIRQRWSPPAGSCPDPPQSSLSQPPPPGYDFYRAPFADFPIIQSHVHPFCVIYNAGQKLLHKPYFTPPAHIDPSDLQIVRRLYDQFTAPVPPTWGRDIPIASREPPSDEGGSRTRSQHTNHAGPSKRLRRASAKTSRAITQTIHTVGKAGRSRRYRVPSSKRMLTLPGKRSLKCPLDISMTAPTPERDSVALTDKPVSCGDCEDRLPLGLKDWADGVASSAAYGEGNALLLNDHQIGSYVREHVRKPPRHPWHSWRVEWGHTHEPDTSRFSSNDWAFWMRTRYLTL
jgi:hypothetical protein